jgi:hypothetical protein
MRTNSYWRGHSAGDRFPDYNDAQRAARDKSGNRWDYFTEPFLNRDRVPVDDLDFINTEYPHTEGR